MFRTIKTQILLVSLILVLLLLSQAFLSRNIQSTFVDNLDLTQQAVIKVSLVRELERDVIDLQRNVLIYKESASESAVIRFNLLMKENQANLTRLEAITSEETKSAIYVDYITRMRSHLNDYQDNFEDVVIGRSKRQLLYNADLLTELEQLFDGLTSRMSDPHVLQDDLQKAKYHIARAENYLLKYLQTPEQEIVESFKQQLTAAKKYLTLQLDIDKSLQGAIDSLTRVESDFLQLTQITRGYLFLVNVVMTGSANEFLFLARELNRLVTEKLTDTNINVKETLDNTRISSDLFSVVGIILAVTTAFFLTYRIMLPINIITNIFKKLAKGRHIETIHGLNRKDEIGQLAQAADVFHEKNKQTTSLLEQSQLLNAKQEALNTQLLASNKQVEQATASKSMFLANMSHEIRTPMNGIIGMLEVVLRSKLTESQRDQLDKAAYSGQILMSLINDILDFSKIEAGKMDIETIEFSVDSMFANILANISNRAQEKSLNVSFYVTPDMPARLLGDPLRISQVLLNLCSNAIKFTRNGSVSIKADYKTIKDTVELEVEVTDTGIGMTSEQVTKVFDSFTQADGSTSRDFGGTGLGLSIVTQLVALMDGEVSVQSQENEGSTFKVNFMLGKTAKENQVIANISSPKGQLFYFSEGRNGLLSVSYIEKMGLTYRHLPLSQLPSTIKDITKHDSVILDISSQTTFKNLHEPIEALVKASLKVGFVTNSQPSNLPNQLTKMWPAECLCHPFTPRQASNFIDNLFFESQNKLNVVANVQEKSCQYEGHILLVEDNNINQVVAGEMLKLLGLTFDIAEDGEQAVTKIINSPQYDLILMDIQMPIMDGYEATRRVRQQGHDSLIICGLSANAMPQDFVKAKDIGMNEYIAKPLKHRALEDLASKYLSKKAH